MSAPAPLPPLDFSTLVLSMATQGFVSLGLVPPPDGSASAIDLEAASQVIDSLAVLETKTRGNLTDDENKLLESLLFDLRVRYVETAKARRDGGASA